MRDVRPKTARPEIAAEFIETTAAGAKLRRLCDSADSRAAIVNDAGAYYCSRCWEYRDAINWRDAA